MIQVNLYSCCDVCPDVSETMAEVSHALGVVQVHCRDV